MDTNLCVMETANFINGRAMNHHEFVALLEEIKSEYGEMIYYKEVRWLSRGVALNHFLFNEIKK